MTPDITVQQPTHRHRVVLVAVALLAVGLVAAAVLARGAVGSTGRYRTATATLGVVTQTLDEVGTIEPVGQASVAFPVAGTVASVDVAVGDQVQVGEVLAVLDAASLDVAVRAAQAGLDQARLDLERALDGEDPGVGAGSAGSAPANGGVVGASLTSDTVGTLVRAVASPGSDDTELRAAQDAVLDGQSEVDQRLGAADEALASARAVCSALAGTDPTTTTTLAEFDASTGACAEALAAALDAQTRLATAQRSLAGASAALDALLAQRAEASATTPSTPEGGLVGGSSPGGSSGVSGGSTASGPMTYSPSSAELTALQKAIDAAAIDLTVAEQAREQGSIVSPVAGTVVAIGMAAGDQVDAASDTATVVIDGGIGMEVTTLVGVTDLPELEVGQEVLVQPDGSDATVHGAVSAIGLVSTTGTSGAAYPVTVSLDDADEVHNGSVATLSIITGIDKDVVSVPTSAVHRDGTTTTVAVLVGDVIREVEVEVGLVGAARTEVVDGLVVGDVVVLADLDAPLPGSATEVDAGTTSSGGGPFDGGPPR